MYCISYALNHMATEKVTQFNCYFDPRNVSETVKNFRFHSFTFKLNAHLPFVRCCRYCLLCICIYYITGEKESIYITIERHTTIIIHLKRLIFCSMEFSVWKSRGSLSLVIHVIIGFSWLLFFCFTIPHSVQAYLLVLRYSIHFSAFNADNTNPVQTQKWLKKMQFLFCCIKYHLPST